MSRKLSRRQFVAATAATSAALVGAPYVRGAYAAGKLSLGFWDHWVPGANKTLTDLVNEWAEKERVETQIDYITSQGQKLLVTISAEAQAKSRSSGRQVARRSRLRRQPDQGSLLPH
jgi:spermidine/putrescine-binding protein